MTIHYHAQPKPDDTRPKEDLMKIMRSVCLFTALLKLLAASRIASTPSEVIEGQRCLAVLGFDPGPIDGVIGTRMADAFARYGTRRGLAGAIDPEAVARRPFRECHARLSRLLPFTMVFPSLGSF
jgi:hypothetical protein